VSNRPTDIVRVRARVPAYDHGWVLEFLRPRAIPGIEEMCDGAYIRALRMGRSIHVLTLTATDSGLQASITPPAPRAELLRSARFMVGADDDLDACRAQLSNDALLGPLVARRPGVRLIRFPDPFEGIARGILGQQVSLAAAATTAGRLTALLGDTLNWSGHSLRAFPAPHAVAGADEGTIRSVGLTRAKATALRASAQAIVDGALDMQRLARVPAAEADAALRALPGIGPWTAAYLRMRVLGDADAFPASDLGVLKALKRILGQEQLRARDAEAVAERWRPWRAYAAIHLWASLSDRLQDFPKVSK
jgi:3-methyladenine DNA glycosylase/8-oxoguanine DNA glycosylase